MCVAGFTSTPTATTTTTSRTSTGKEFDESFHFPRPYGVYLIWYHDAHGLLGACLRLAVFATRTGEGNAPLWRRILASMGLLSVTVQALLFILSWTRIGRDTVLFGKWANWLYPTFLVAVIGVLAGKGTSRWWLLSSSVLLFVMCFLFTLTA